MISNIYSPTELQQQVCAELRADSKVAEFVTDEEIHAAVAAVFPRCVKDIALYTKVHLIQKVILDRKLGGSV